MKTYPFLYVLDITHGEYSFQSKGVIRAATPASADKKAVIIASQFYGKGTREDESSFSFNHGEVMVQARFTRVLEDADLPALAKAGIVGA